MLLTVDIGNSTTKFGVFDDEKIVARHTIPTIRGKSADQINESINGELNFRVESVIISTVVPELNKSFTGLCESSFNVTPVFVSHDFDFGFTNKYNPPESVGIDRLIAAFAGVEKYGKPCIICDFGTATTIDAVNSSNEYLGGIITAGMNLLADSLHQRTSKLPQISLRKPEKVIGNSTVSAIQSGVYFGYIGLVDGLIKRIIDELGENPQVIATGGLASLIAETSEMIDLVDDTLMLEGLNRLMVKGKRGKV
jgi:type III pantothenate kinase